MQIGLDGQPLATILDFKALKAGVCVPLGDGDTLEIKLQTWMLPGLQISRNGVPLAGSAGDPAQQVKVVRGIVWCVGGLTLVLGVLAELGRVDLLLGLGLSWLTAAAGVVFVVLGYLVGRRSRLALGAAIALLVADAVTGLHVAAEAGGRVPTESLIVRLFFLIAMFQGFKAISDLEAAAQVKASAEVF